MRNIELVPGYEISPVIKGGWQLSAGHSLDGTISEEIAIAEIISFIDAGISTLDFGDIYIGVEVLIGKALATIQGRDGSNGQQKVQLHTKYVPNKTSLDNYDSTDARKIVLRSLERLGVERVDLVQFHWWNYEARNYLAALEQLFILRADGHIREIGLTNFDLKRLTEIVEAGFTPASIQLQYSILDRRPEPEMVEYCLELGIGILSYGTVAGGFLSERFINQPEPTSFETRSAIKYKLIIDEFGGWKLFQELLATLTPIARNHDTDIGTIASAFTLNSPGVKAVIVGARNLRHLSSNLSIPEIALTSADRVAINTILERSTGPLGEVYGLERYDDGHRGIMHANNN